MSVIKTLDASENNEERDREKLKIEKEYKKSDKKLAELVSQHDSELTKVSIFNLILRPHSMANHFLLDYAIIFKNIRRS